MALAIVAVAYLLTAAGAEPEPRDKIDFGLTRYLPLASPGTVASDYVAGGAKVAIAAVRLCGGKRAISKTYTDGAAGVLFTRTRSEASTRACLAKALPQATYRIDQSW